MPIYTVAGWNPDEDRWRTLLVDAANAGAAETLAVDAGMRVERIALTQDQTLEPDLPGADDGRWQPPAAIGCGGVTGVIVSACVLAVLFRGHPVPADVAMVVFVILAVALSLWGLHHKLDQLDQRVRRMSMGPDERGRRGPDGTNDADR